jgi:hypothetical protein
MNDSTSPPLENGVDSLKGDPLPMWRDRFAIDSQWHSL